MNEIENGKDEKPAVALMKHGQLTDKILNVFYKMVYPGLGYGFLEKIYQNAMVLELQDIGL
jgi:hypothetical protein